MVGTVSMASGRVLGKVDTHAETVFIPGRQVMCQVRGALDAHFEPSPKCAKVAQPHRHIFIGCAVWCNSAAPYDP